MPTLSANSLFSPSGLTGKGIQMGKRQMMQKFIVNGFTAPGGLGAGAAKVALEQQIPEEVIIKRIVANCITSDGQPFAVHVVQTDNGTAAIADSLEVNRLVKTNYAAATNQINMDFTLTMRKFAGSSVALLLTNLGASAGGFQYKLTLHYIEV